MTKYELLERIGVGGMAEIYRGRATAVGGFEKPVAIKKILPHLGRDDRFVKMLIAEAKLLSSLRHRNIVNIYDVGLGEDGEYFLVMEFVEGRDLGALVDRMQHDQVRFPSDLALYLASEVCDALDHAHRAVGDDGRPLGIVHRDISPSNVLLSFSGEVKLTDFGIAKPADEKSVVATIKGKFAYMSPEQAYAGALDQTSDLFSLGVILYELLLGRPLFSHGSELVALRAVREARVPRPREVDPTFSRELEAILLRALAKEPRQRWQSASALGAALRDYRYSAATSGGDPAKEISNLVKRFFPTQRSQEGQRTVVRIKTVAGFPSRHGLEDEAPTTARMLPEDRTRAQPGLSAMLAARAEGVGEDALARLLDAAPVDPQRAVSDDAETKLVDLGARERHARGDKERNGRGARDRDGQAARERDGRSAGDVVRERNGRGREATPTVRDAFPAALFEDGGRELGPGTPGPQVQTPLPRARRRRALMWAIVLTAVAALGAGVAFAIHLGGAGDPAPSGDTMTGPSGRAGEALEVPTIKAPVKKQR